MKNALLFIMALMVCGGGEAQPLKGKRPNIILVMTDDQGPLLSCMGHPVLKTPHIDRFAEKSLRLTEFHVSPTCAPTRAALMSGRHEFKNGVTHTIKERELMALSTTTFPQLLQQAGYETGIFGKWHLGDIEEYRPGNRGFTEAFTHGAGGIGQKYPGSCADFPPNKKNRYYDNVLLHNDTVVKTKGYCTDVFFRAALGWIKKNHEAQKPFFAYIAPNAPHNPLIAPKENVRRIDKRHPGLSKDTLNRWGMVENIDDNFGLLMEKLEEWGALENTLVIFTTDNGMCTSDGKTEAAWTGGYKSGKTSPAEGGTHVPCFWYWKNVLPEGKDVNALTAHFDLYKTFCGLAGATISSGIQELDGRSLIPLLENPDAEWKDRMLFVHSGRWDKGEEPQRDERYAVRTQRWRLVGDELYDISNDPYEKQDVVAQYPEVVERLNAARFTWWEETLPLMVNEDREYAGEEPPFFELYDSQKKAQGIPEWVPPEI
ncbi:arylsulfatase [Pontiella sulfatireligans]|uniref:Arylsulfatase n=1 Tax=Pontiella sulfatireligans TaxID=2750658 RepID=A0A6C2UG25_9BACT|nr:arylsulfatase [Pontiella sulfatireligans]SPS74247.1 sulfatase S1_17 [Kiritimatiellales bacterium]VGO18823.1 Arylsulfatase [Pontiella sulfatireligans]